jgi:MFS transporter, DHA2 family, multidrug resistance protein
MKLSSVLTIDGLLVSGCDHLYRTAQETTLRTRRLCAPARSSSSDRDDARQAPARKATRVNDQKPPPSGAPARAGLVLTTLILVAAVANLNLSVANVALPDIGKHFDSSQTALDLIAVGYSLGLACSVLWLGALGDRYGRKMICLLGTILAIPMSLLAALAPSDTVLFLARLGGGIAAGMAYPTTLALITALWSGAPRTKAIALWSGIGAAIAALGPLCAGILLEHFEWGSVFFLTLPLAVVAIVMVWRLVPAHVNETTESVDNIGGVLSLVLVGTLILAINFAPVPNQTALTVALGAAAAVALVLFYLRQRRARNPLYDLTIAARPPFWVGAVAGIIVFGSLMGAMFIGQQFLQNVLAYSTRDAGAAILPGAIFMVLVAPRSAKIIESHGTRVSVLIGQFFVFLGFLWMLLLWKQAIPYWKVGVGYALVGIGVGLAGPPTSNVLTGSVPVRRVGMASGTADLQRDLGGAIMQSILGALLTAGYAATAAAELSGKHVTSSIENTLTKSFASAADAAQQYPAHSSQIIEGAKTAFLHGAEWAYAAGIIAVLIGVVLVFFKFPHHDREKQLLAEYQASADDTTVAEAGEHSRDAGEAPRGPVRGEPEPGLAPGG